MAYTILAKQASKPRLMSHLDSMTEHQDDPPQTVDYHGLNYQFDDPPQAMGTTIPNLFLLLLDLIFCLVAALFLGKITWHNPNRSIKDTFSHYLEHLIGLACLALALKNRPIDDHVGLTTMKLAKLVGTPITTFLNYCHTKKDL